MNAAAGGVGEAALQALLEPAHLVVLIVIALLLGPPGWRVARDAWMAFAVGLIAGLALAAAGRGGDTGAALLVIAAVGGGLVALGRPMPMPLLGGIAGAAGAGLGIGTELEAPAWAGRLAMLALVFAGSGIAAVALAAMAARLQRPWGRVLVRVAGSWMTAVALLVLALLIARSRGG